MVSAAFISELGGDKMAAFSLHVGSDGATALGSFQGVALPIEHEFTPWVQKARICDSPLTYHHLFR
ncbi:MAG: hypothetical protein MZU95_00755 [Desulfomicrobium escambiense]|nr:hypothetical protein [Desulfomicrobium escambiense]